MKSLHSQKFVIESALEDSDRIIQDSYSALIKSFLNSRSLSSNSLKAYQQDLTRFIKWSEHPLADITENEILVYRKFLEEGKLASTTIRRNLSILKSFFRWLEQNSYISMSPSRSIDIPELVESKANELTESELDLIWQVINTRSNYPERDRAIIWTLHFVYCSEALQLNISNYDGKCLHLESAVRNQVGEIPLTTQAIEALDRYITWRQKRGELLEQMTPLFVSESNQSKWQRLTYWGIRKIVDSIAEHLPPDIDFHANRLRDTLCVQAQMRGLNMVSLMKNMRFSPNTSLRFSDRVREQAVRQSFYKAFGEEPPNKGNEACKCVEKE